jgi:nucleolar protein 14
MPPSQLKRLKASLREQGITGPPKSKKQKKNREGDNADQRAKKSAALAGIRESFNPFEFKTLSRPKKFEIVTNRPETKVVLGRPGVSKSHGEETRRKTLLPEMHRRNKVGGILDRRIGENDPTMSLDDKMMARFTREQAKRKGVSVFDLEEADDEVELTHGGQTLKFDLEDDREDYDAASVGGLSDDEEDGLLRRKRRRDSDVGEGEEDDDADATDNRPERKKSKAEVMKEVMAKSKLHKYERQQAKEEDEELREELDKDLPDILAALKGHITKPPPPPPQLAAEPKDAQKNDFSMNADRAALLAGKSREQLDKEYDSRVRQMMFDQKAQPTERTKTDEEKAKEEAERLKKLEESRMRRMRGEEMESEPEDQKKDEEEEEDELNEEDEESERDDAKEFGLPSAARTRPQGIEDEDDFIMDDDLIASDSEADISESEEEEDSEDETMAMDEDDEFLKKVLPGSSKQKNDAKGTGANTTSKLAYTYPCPQSHDELLEVFDGKSHTDAPLIVQRIRALYHSGLHPENKTKLANFAGALVDHISYMASQKPAAPLTLIETIIRHVHSMSRSYPEQIATRFRHHLKQLQVSNDPTPGDLALLTAIGTIYPTSDHFHQVVTPAITLMARWLGLSTPQCPKDIAIGAYLGALCIKYQTLAKRYIPELIRYTNLALQSPHSTPSLKEAHLKNLFSMTDLWSTKSAFPEIFTPTLAILKTTHSCASHQHLQILLNNALLNRRPLTLHNHRPLPIKTSIPKFEESFDPNKHYDPDKDRAEAARFKKEFKRERKGAMRELRKDSHFIAREQLKEKKERDRRYEEKYRKLVAEIQGEEGAEKNRYERERKNRGRK